MRQAIYEMIIKEKMGNDFYYQTELIKDSLCEKCTKRRSKQCRLVIVDSQCKNFKEVKKK